MKNTKNKFQHLKQFAVGVGLTLATGVASAAVDVSAATGAISGDGATAITAIGQALIGLAGLAVTFKWAKGAIFG